MGGGKPIRQHSIVAGVIADMSIGIKMMQASTYNMAYMLEHPEEYGPPWSKEMLANGAATKIFAGDTSVDVVVKGMELMAANGISEAYEYEQLYRDVITSKLTIAGHQVGRYRLIEPLYELQPD
jgi:alkylation response protein AidB-like acyl-CoA dehydrogenase